MALNNRSVVWLVVAALCPPPVLGEVVRIDVVERGDVAAGAPYGAADAYEKLRGTLHFAVDPSAAANCFVTDLNLAATNADSQNRLRTPSA